MSTQLRNNKHAKESQRKQHQTNEAILLNLIWAFLLYIGEALFANLLYTEGALGLRVWSLGQHQASRIKFELRN